MTLQFFYPLRMFYRRWVFLRVWWYWRSSSRTRQDWADVAIRTGVTVGGSSGYKGVPWIGNNVYIAMQKPHGIKDICFALEEPVNEL